MGSFRAPKCWSVQRYAMQVPRSPPGNRLSWGAPSSWQPREVTHPRRVRLRWRARARSGIFVFADRHSQQIPKASRRWPLMHRRARYGDAGGAWTGSTSAQNGSRWCSAQTAFSRSRGTSANHPQRGQAIMQLTSTELATGRIGPEPRIGCTPAHVYAQRKSQQRLTRSATTSSVAGSCSCRGAWGEQASSLPARSARCDRASAQRGSSRTAARGGQA
jgi:hypothetical protein